MAFKKLTAGLMASSMILGLAASASAEITTATPFDTASKMNKLGVVMGVGTNPDGTIDFNLGGNLTRAELVTTIVRSFGAEQSAQLAKGAPSFADVTADAWYSGYVAVAKNLASKAGTAIGRDANTFDPNANVSKAEALVFVMKFLGIKVESTGANWYEAWIAKAVQLGMISQADAAVALANPDSAATRGESFVILDFGYSAKVLEGGKSLYTTYVDAAAPTVEVAAPAESTTNAKITVSGKVSDNKAVASVAVNGTAVTVTDGNFSTEVALTVGANTITVTATDLAGNVATKPFTVTRTNAAATSIEAAEITVAAGGTATVTATAKDANGEAISGATFEGTSTVGTFAGTTFTAGEKAGEGTLTLKYGELTKGVKVTVTAGDLAKVVAPAGLAPSKVAALSATDSFGNAITGVTFTVKGSDKAYVDGAGNFFASAAGSYTVLATKGDKSIEGTVGVYGAIAAYKISAPEKAVANKETTYKAQIKAVDKDGNLVADATNNVTVTSAFGDDTVTLENGVGTYEFTADDSLTGEAISIDVADANDFEGTVDVSVVAQVATSIKITGAKYLTTNDADVPTGVTVDVVDQEGESMLDGAFDIKLAVTGPAAFKDKDDADYAWAPSPAAVEFVPTEEGATGEVTISATAEGLTAGTLKMTAAVAQAAKNIVITAPTATTVKANDDALAAADLPNKAAYYKVSLTDKYGVPVTGAAAEKDFKISFPEIASTAKAQTFIAFDYDGNGVLSMGEGFVDASATRLVAWDDLTVSGKFGFWVVGQKAGSFNVKVEEDATTPTLNAASTSFSVVANAATHFTKSADDYVVLKRGAKATFEYKLVDADENTVAKKGVEVVFSVPAGASYTINGKGAGKSVTVETDANGVAKIEVATSALIDLTAPEIVLVDVVATNTANGWTAPAATAQEVKIASSVVVPASVSVSFEKLVMVAPAGSPAGAPATVPTWVAYTGAIDAGQKFRIKVTVKDADGYGIPSSGFNLLDVDGDGTNLLSVLDGKDYLATQTVAGVTTELIDWAEGTADGVYYAYTDATAGAEVGFTAEVMGNHTYNVELSGLPTSLKASSRSVSVRAGDVVGLAIKEVDATEGVVYVEDGKAKQLTVIAVDFYGNQVSGAKVIADMQLTFSPTAATGKYMSFRNANGDELISEGIKIAKGRSSATFFLVTDNVSGDFQIFKDADDDNTYDVGELTTGAVNLDVK